MGREALDKLLTNFKTKAGRGRPPQVEDRPGDGPEQERVWVVGGSSAEGGVGVGSRGDEVLAAPESPGMHTGHGREQAVSLPRREKASRPCQPRTSTARAEGFPRPVCGQQVGKGPARHCR